VPPIAHNALPHSCFECIDNGQFRLLTRRGGALRVRANLCAVLTLAFGLFAEGACGHAIVVAGRPAMNASVAPGKLEIRLEFNSRIDRQRSRLSLLRPDGTLAEVASVPDDSQNVLAANIDATMSGPWKLDWQVLSLDGHITRGTVRFSVR
jgi:methionine-rich copper-binding protein CopC